MMDIKTGKGEMIPRLGVALLVLGASVVFLVQCTANPWQLSPAITDSGVFQYIGMLMAKGYMPYRDIFDHKGPLLLYLNYLGYRIHPLHGIWFVELLSLFAAFAGMYRAARFHSGRATSLCIVFLVGGVCYPYLKGGDFCEEFAMPFIAWALCIFLDYFLNGRVTPLRLNLLGVGFGCVLMLRPNMVAVWIVFCISVLIKCLKEKQYAALGHYVLWFLTGATIVVGACCIWLLANGAFSDFIADYIKFNIAYSGAEGGNSRFRVISTVLTFLKDPLLLISLCCISCFCRAEREKRYSNISCLAAIILSLLLLSMAGEAYEHYFLMMFPLLPYPLALAFGTILNGNNRQAVLPGLLLLCYMCVTMAAPAWISALQRVAEYTRAETTDVYLDPETEQLVDTVNACSAPDDKIMMWGNYKGCWVAQYCGRESASRFIYQPWTDLLGTTDVGRTEFLQDIAEKQPKLILVQYVPTENYDTYQSLQERLDAGHYTIVAETESYHVYLKQDI